MTNFYEYRCTRDIINIVEDLNPRRLEYFSFNTISKLISVRRDYYQKLEDLSKEIGELITLP